ncbi:MAG: DEAD/DEAH box helicase family protein [Bacillota bacterium]|nr:DEAD/DEAH box helicase family protein [Bacillota bacterium]
MDRKPPGTSVAIPGIANGICQRCLTEIPEGVYDEWGKRYCRACLTFGHVNETTLLYRQDRPLTTVLHRLVPVFPPTAEQKLAGAYVRDRIVPGGRGFVHAVCGAGKTEILYEGILRALNAGFRVCVAIPRRDVVRELAERLSPIFPDTSIKVLYQGSRDDAGAHLLVSTIHQLINYHQEFDLVVIDEADAFPFRGDAFLHGIVKKAMKPDAALIEMSATPQDGRPKDAYFLPARFHRRPLDVPVIAYVDGLVAALQNKTIPSAVLVWLRGVKPPRKAMLFVPDIAYGCLLSDLLARDGFRVTNVSSQEAAAPLRIRAFREGKVDLIVTTTLLERGVTFRDIDVAVFSAEREIFTKNVLIQMAGRVGRHPEAPTGDIRFFAEIASAEMMRAIRAVEAANAVAHRRGLVDDDL